MWVARDVHPGWPVVTDQTVVFVGRGEHSLLAVDRETGRQRWALEVPEAIAGESLLAVGDQLIFSQQSGRLSSLGLADGTPRWQVDLGCMLTYPIATASVVVAGCWPVKGTEVGIVGVDAASGTRRWFSATPAIIGVPGTDSQTAYVPLEDQRGHGHHIAAIDVASGRERWRTAIGNELSHALIVGDTVVALGRQLHGLAAASGRPVWTADRFDPDPPDRFARALRAHRGLVVRPRPGAIEGLDPRTGAVAATWKVPVSHGGATAMALAGVYDLGDALAIPVNADDGDLMVWRESRTDVLPLPSGRLTGATGRLALISNEDLESIDWSVAMTAVDLEPAGRQDGRVIPTLSAPVWTEPPQCEWDAANDPEHAHLDIGLGPGPYQRRRDDLYFSSSPVSGSVLTLGLAGEGLDSIGIKGAPARIAVDDDYVYWGEGDGGDHRLVQVARRDASRVTLARGLPGVDLVATAGSHVYWSAGEALHRIARDGGPVETAWRGARVTAIAVDRDQLFFVAGAALRSVASRGRPLARALEGSPPLAFDRDHVYVAAPGANGATAVLQVPRAGGRVRELYASDRKPQAIAVDDRRVYLAIQNGEILSVGRDGRGPSVVARALPSNPCGEIWSLEVAGGALAWIGADRPGGEYGSLWTVQL